MSISVALEKLRAQKGCTWGDIYRGTGLERPYLSRIGSGKTKSMSVKNAIKLARFFNLTVEEFWSLCQEEAEASGGKKDWVNTEGRE